MNRKYSVVLTDTQGTSVTWDYTDYSDALHQYRWAKNRQASDTKLRLEAEGNPLPVVMEVSDLIRRSVMGLF